MGNTEKLATAKRLMDEIHKKQRTNVVFISREWQVDIAIAIEDVMRQHPEFTFGSNIIYLLTGDEADMEIVLGAYPFLKAVANRLQVYENSIS